MPTVSKMMRGMRGNDVSNLTPANEALMFAISYAAVTSMEEDDVSLLYFGIHLMCFEPSLRYLPRS